MKGIFVIGIAGASALAGFVAGYFVSKKRLEKMYEERCVESIQQELDKIHKTISTKRIVKETEIVEPVERETPSDDRSYTPYSKMYNIVNEYGELEEIEYEEQSPDDFYDNCDPEVITLEAFKDLPDSYEIMTWHYWEEDDTLTDESDSVVREIEHTIGFDALTIFGEEAQRLSDSEDPDCVYVVNGKTRQGIEVVCMHSSFREYIGGKK